MSEWKDELAKYEINTFYFELLTSKTKNESDTTDFHP